MEQTDSYQRGGTEGGRMKEGEGMSQRTSLAQPIDTDGSVVMARVKRG